MGSSSYTEQVDNRLAIEGDIGQVTAPGSQIANPLGIAVGVGDRSHNTSTNVSYGDVTVNEYPADLNELLTSMAKYSNDSIEAALNESRAVLNRSSDLVEESIYNSRASVSDAISQSRGIIDEVLYSGRANLLDMLDSSQKFIETILDDSQQTLNTVSDTTDTLSKVVEGTKTPLSQYVPYAVLAVVLLMVWKFGSK